MNCEGDWIQAACLPPAVLTLCTHLEKTRGVKVHRVPVDHHGRLDLNAYGKALTPRVAASRERFYGRMVWVASGTRLKRDLPTFREALVLAPAAITDHLALVLPVDGSAIIERWRGSRCPVYLDFGNEHIGLPGLSSKPILWRLHFRIGDVVATPISRSSFIEHHRGCAPLRGYRRRVIVPYRRSDIWPRRRRGGRDSEVVGLLSQGSIRGQASLFGR
ncbi:hypothetical protein EV129_11518 [Rhizobium azibense]|uniref:Uncharacterized protein n=1 Tax=Rhizobium azibense TaxID=1136135 RepID=A0A4R3RDD7_9HYPH|nr:hypothetical protein EV129_11518 [Rhizobium azibense]